MLFLLKSILKDYGDKAVIQALSQIISYRADEESDMGLKEKCIASSNIAELLSKISDDIEE